MNTAILKLSGKDYVVLERGEYLAILRGKLPRHRPRPTALPEKLPNGNYEADAALRAAIARKLTFDRTAAGMTQAELAAAAKVRPSTIARIEAARCVPGLATMAKIEKAMVPSGRGRTSRIAASHGARAHIR